MVLDLANVYSQKIDADTIVTLLGQLGKNLIAMVGATAAAPALASGDWVGAQDGAGNRHDRGRRRAGIGAGARDAVDRPRVLRILPQRNAAAAGRHWRSWPAAKWAEVTRPEQLRKLIQLGREKLKGDRN